MSEILLVLSSSTRKYWSFVIWLFEVGLDKPWSFPNPNHKALMFGGCSLGGGAVIRQSKSQSLASPETSGIVTGPDTELHVASNVFIGL